MNLFPSYTVGTRVPDSPHAVCCSLPTLREVIGYEEEDPAIRKHVISGYPRFVEHTYLRRLAEHVRTELGLQNRTVALAPSKRAVEGLLEFLDCPEAGKREWGSIQVVELPQGEDLARKARRFFQHTGCGLSSREAEDLLVNAGILKERHPDMDPPGDPETLIRKGLIEACPEADPDSLLLSRSGMNAFYSAFRAARRVQRPRGKTVWIQFGWLYLDTIRILEKFLRPEERCVTLPDAGDTAALEAVFEREGDLIAGVITETPTNPLLQTADLARARELCDRHGTLLLVDPSLTSFYNVDVMPYADVALHSLTKYFGHHGDLMMGLAAFNTARGSLVRELHRLAREEHEPPYHRELRQLAAQIGNARRTVETINRNTLRVAAYLESHPKIKRLHWACGEATSAGYRKLARGPDRPGGILTLDLNMPLAEFYDAAPFVKGPSFGTTFTMMCPFMYLAHYDLVARPEGREHLRQQGIDPELVRVSIGTEAAEDIIEGFRRALGE